MTGSFEGRPAYLQIADDLRRQILDGELQDGDQLPTAQEIMDDYGVSRIVVRNAINVLRSEGLVRTQQGSGTYVRQHKPLKKRVMGDLYGKRPTASPFAQSARTAGKQADWEYQSRVTKATKAVADRLGIEPGDDVMRTQYRFFVDEVPTMLSTSYEPLAITRGTDIEQPEAGKVTGVVPRMDHIGVHITHVTEDVYARAPRPFEADKLEVPQGVPVMAIERTYYADDKPVETADIIVPADRYALSYTIRVPEA
ncbi:GntR family transcriptional regulator [Actinosynnema sp. NPDC023587]|uniref:GntR family transcriptional regulator n=1 Tax=Actinosynnema sp. NPDC023587 TaxID=3154695 RepID=UPI0033F2AF29